VKTKTTTTQFREGVKLSSKGGDEIRWGSTGHLSVRLLDASGTIPLAKRAVTVVVPGEGTVSLETDDDGELFHPDVPYQDYELDLDGLKVLVPAVGERSEVHERHVVVAPMGFVQAVIYGPGGTVLAGAKLELEFASGARVEAQTDEAGVVRCHQADPGDGDVTIRCEHGQCTTRPMASPQKLVRLTLEDRT
jgi:hypothetical protein